VSRAPASAFDAAVAPRSLAERAGRKLVGARLRIGRVVDSLLPPPRTDEARAPAVREAVAAAPTPVDRFWDEHTLNPRPFRSARESERHLEWRFAQYPLFRELMDLWGEHDGETILDYGCGPGDDVTGFLLYTRARRVIGMDVSPRALRLTRHRLALHRVDLDRVELVQTNDASATVPLPDASVDFVNCGGVLHHTSHPEAILGELRRVLRPGGRAHVMVYNRDSVFFHLFTAYVRMLLEGAFPGHPVEEAFRRNTDGPECPVSRAYRPAEFAALCESAGFEARFVGGYLSYWDVGSLEHLGRAVADGRLADEHREFLARVDRDERGFPLHGGKHAGGGGVYRLRAA
jgi:SAM-dependent methyltransferase